MKKIIQSLNAKSLVIGWVLGFFISLFIFSALVPSGPDMIRVYNMQKYRNMRSGSVMVDNMNRYMNGGGEITSEKQFVEEMIEHHNAAITMSRQVLMINPREEVKNLALNIIKAQSTEIKMMKDWLVNWKN